MRPARLFAPQLVEHEARHRASDTSEDRRGKGAHHGAHRARHQPHNPVHKFGNYAVVGVLTLRRLLLQRDQLRLGLCPLLRRRGTDRVDQRPKRAIKRGRRGNADDLVAADDVTADRADRSRDVYAAALTNIDFFAHSRLQIPRVTSRRETDWPMQLSTRYSMSQNRDIWKATAPFSEGWTT